MSRSIHENRSRRHFAKKEQIDYDELSKKRLIKIDSVASPKNTDALVSQSAQSIPIIIGKLNKFLFFPISTEEIHQVMSLLPIGAFSGIKAIHLQNGKQANQYSNDFDIIDPFTGMKSSEIFPNIYIPMILGTYSMNTGTIKIYAFVKDPLVIPTDVQLLELRHNMLHTLFHEIAHHQDRTTRVARGRWRMDDHFKRETYAEDMESKWCQSIITPFLKLRAT